jgi:iron complex transport system substrate-binding protein
MHRAAALLILAFCCLPPAFAQTISPSNRIVSTSPSITETLFALGLGPRVVGVSQFCSYPPEVVKLPKVGAYLKPDPELIAQLRPDLVILHKLPGGTAGRLSALHIRFVEVDRGSLDDMYRSIHQIADAAGFPPKGDELARSIQWRLERIHEQAAGLPQPSVLFLIGRTPGTLSGLIAAGTDSYIGEMIRIAGGRNVLASGSIEWPRISLETLVAGDPDIIVDTAEMSGMKSTKEVSPWDQKRELKAVRNARVYSIDSGVYLVPGPRVVEATESLFALFHGRKAQ